jgi:hypothetical protein
MLHFSVIPAKAGIQNILIKLDSRHSRDFMTVYNFTFPNRRIR